MPPWAICSSAESATDSFQTDSKIDHRHQPERRELRDHAGVCRCAVTRSIWSGFSPFRHSCHHGSPSRLVNLRRPTRRLRARMSNELSSPAADKELDCFGRIRLSPSARIRAISLMRSSVPIRLDGSGLGPDWICCMGPFATRVDQRTVVAKWYESSEFNKLSYALEIIRSRAQGAQAGVSMQRQADGAIDTNGKGIVHSRASSLDPLSHLASLIR